MNWDGVRQRVLALADEPWAHAVDGVDAHRFHVEPPLSVADLAELVGQIGVGLPEDYASFLTEVGRGGAGPGYGLFPVNRVDGHWRWEGDGAQLTTQADLDQPFPYQDTVDPRVGLSPQPRQVDYPTTEGYDAALRAYDSYYDETIYGRRHTAGAQFISHLGCARRHLLIISGSERGTIWTDDRPNGGPLRPEHDPSGARLTFTRWYLQWLDQAEDTILR